MNGGGDHAADERRGNRFHNIGTDAALPQNRNKTRQYNAYGHEFRPEALYCAFDDGFLYVFMLQWLSVCEPPIECFVEVHDHNDAGLDRNAEQRDIANPHRHTEVVAQQLLQDEAAGECIERRENEHCRFRERVKHHVKQHKNNEEHDRKYDLQALLGPQFKFIFARPFVGVTRRQMELLLEHVIGGFYEVAIISGIKVDVDVSGESSVLITDHGGPA